jgi:hypothetical protein
MNCIGFKGWGSFGESLISPIARAFLGQKPFLHEDNDGVVDMAQDFVGAYQNSQILRRPQDDRKSGRLVILCLQKTPQMSVIPRPPRDLVFAVGS